MLMEMLENREYMEINSITMKNLPKIGHIALLSGKKPIAAGFLRRVEGGYAQLDGLVSNPHFGSIIRNQGITEVVNNLIRDAKALKLNGIIAFTADKSVILRAEAIGFHNVNQSMIVLRF